MVTSTPIPALPGISSFTQHKQDERIPHPVSMPHPTHAQLSPTSLPLMHGTTMHQQLSPTSLHQIHAINMQQQFSPTSLPSMHAQVMHQQLSPTMFQQKYNHPDQTGHILNPLATANFSNGPNVCDSYKNIEQVFFSRNFDTKSVSESDESDKENSEKKSKSSRGIWSITEIMAPRDSSDSASDTSVSGSEESASISPKI